MIFCELLTDLVNDHDSVLGQEPAGGAAFSTLIYLIACMCTHLHMQTTKSPRTPQQCFKLIIGNEHGSIFIWDECEYQSWLGGTGRWMGNVKEKWSCGKKGGLERTGMVNASDRERGE